MTRTRGRRNRKPAEARSLGFAVGDGARESVRLRVYRVLSAWSGLSVPRVPPDGKKLTLLWQEKSGNPQINDGVLSDLVVRLQSEFPRAGLVLAPNDLTRDDGADTVARLVAHVELRMVGE